MRVTLGGGPGATMARVIDAVAYLIIGAALVGAAWSGLLMLLDRRLNDALFWLLAALEVGLLVQLVGGCVALARTDRDVDGLTFVAYLISIVLVLPFAVAWAASEKSRWGTGVLLAGCLTVAVLALRVSQIWAGQP